MLGCAAPAKLPPHVKAIRNVSYGPAKGRDNLLDVFLPENADHALPAVIWVHGGGWNAGDKSPCPATAIVPYGFVAVSLNYRLTGTDPFPAQIEDCKGAIRFLRAHTAEYHIDPDHLGVWGESAGGHLVALLGTSGDDKKIEGTVGGNADKSSKVQAVCDWFGPTDMSAFPAQADAEHIDKSTVAPPLIRGLLGGDPADKKELLKLTNPLEYITEKTAASLPQFLIQHGDRDPVVPVGQSRMLNDALKKVGATVEFTVVKNAGHGDGFDRAEVRKQVLAFFQKSLKS